MLTGINAEGFRALYFALASQYPHSILLDSCNWTGPTGGLYVMGFEATDTLQFKAGHLIHNQHNLGGFKSPDRLWQAVEQIVQNKAILTPAHAEWPWVNGWFGALGYELNHWIEPRVPQRDNPHPMGDMYWVRFQHRIVWDAVQQHCWVLSPDSTWIDSCQATWQQIVASGQNEQTNPMPLPHPLTEASCALTEAEFNDRVEQILTHLRAGNIYQANLSLRFEHTRVSREIIKPLYQQLVHSNPSPFSGLLQTPDGTIVSNSPERLVKYCPQSNIVEARPIAGTRGRGRTAQETAHITQTLQNDIKEQAEHCMLVDLERNDIGRVSQTGSVTVPELGVIEQYSHVTHLVSQIEGQKTSTASAWDILRAMFPGGTITGCPKVRCMQILSELEPVPRGFYTGSLGYLADNGAMDFNILIRSAFYATQDAEANTGSLHYHAGAGIVLDSVAAWEYRECFRKAAAMQNALGLQKAPATSTMH